MTTTQARMRVRRGTGAQWISANPILGLGEIAWETDSLTGKVGDGTTVYTSLPYGLGGVSDSAVAALVTGATSTQSAMDARFAKIDDNGYNVLRHGVTGNGTTDDTAAIHAARTAAGAFGADLIFPDGTYLVSGLTANVSGQRWLMMPGAVISLKNASNAPVITATAPLAISGGTISGNRANQTSSGYGIRATSQSSVHVEGVTFQNTFSEGVYLTSCSDVLIADCTFTNCAAAGNHKAILLDDLSGSYSKVRLNRNYIDGTTSQTGGMQVVSTTSGNTAQDITVHNNTILVGDNAADVLGIEFYSNSSGSIINGSVMGNSIRAPGTGTTAFGISIGGVASTSTTGNNGISVVGNTVKNCHGPGVELIGRNLTCAANTFETCGRISVPSIDVAGGQTGVTVVGNVIRNAQDSNYAIQLSGNATNAMSGTICANNIIEGATGIGINIAGQFLDGIVENNVVRKPLGIGISVVASTVTTGSRISNNRVEMTGATGTIDAIMVNSTAAADMIIEGNIITASPRYGIMFNVAVNRMTVRNNQISGCTNNGIMTTGGDKFVIYGNHVHDNSGRGISLSGSPTLTWLGQNNCYNNTGGDIVTGGTFSPADLSGTTATTAPAAGGAGALPATPAGYLTVRVNGTNRQVPYY